MFNSNLRMTIQHQMNKMEPQNVIVSTNVDLFNRNSNQVIFCIDMTSLLVKYGTNTILDILETTNFSLKYCPDISFNFKLFF